MFLKISGTGEFIGLGCLDEYWNFLILLLYDEGREFYDWRDLLWVRKNLGARGRKSLLKLLKRRNRLSWKKRINKFYRGGDYSQSSTSVISACVYLLSVHFAISDMFVFSVAL